jgi:hypothetical protein
MRADRWWRESLALFAVTAWAAWVVPVPPLQDLPNHLASAFVQSHLASYPELVSNGFLKTNATLFLFLHLASKVVSLRVAAKLFVTLTCAVGAFAYPRAVRALGGNVRSASFLLWPFVHNWFLAMGMLDWALAVPLVLLVLVELRARPILAAVLAVGVWYTHAFGVVVLALLVVLEAAARRSARDLWKLGAPLAPALALTLWSVVLQLGSETHAPGGAVLFQSPAELLYSAWAEWLWSMSRWTAATVVCAGALAYFGARRFREPRPFFSPLALAALVVLYVALPHQLRHWYYVSSRLLPFAWFACALRVPELPRWAKGALGACAFSFGAGLGVEYMQNARVWTGFCRGEVAVPEGARLLPMIFDRKGPHGENTWPMQHAWGLYVIDRGTSAPIVFAHSRSFALRYAKEPPPELHDIALEYFPQHMKTPAVYCAEHHVTADCVGAYRRAWRTFWAEATPRFDRVVMFGATPAARAEIPKTFRVLYDEGETLVLATGPA